MANKASILRAARKTALASVAVAALNESVARDRVIVLLRQAGAKHIDKPDGEASAAVKAAIAYQREIRDEYIVGRMAARLASNQDEAGRIAAARKVLAKANAKSQDATRRTEIEERAYGAARVAWSGILKDAGIVSASKRGGDTSKTRKPRQTKGTTSTPAPTPKATNPASLPSFRTGLQVDSYVQQQMAMLLAFLNKNAGKGDPRINTAIHTAKQTVDALMDAIKASKL